MMTTMTKPKFKLARGPARLTGLFCALMLCAAAAPAAEPKAVTVARGLVNPWGLAFLPDGRLLVTEKPGRLRVIAADGRVGAPVQGLPPVDSGGQCGLLDVVVDPGSGTSPIVYWSFAEAGEGGNGTAVARGRLETGAGGSRLVDVQTIFRQLPKVASSNHCGSRIVFARDGRLFVGLGDRFSRKDDAQTLDNHLGKVVRIERDGRVPADNPFVAAQGARPEIWSRGHRNIQGMALHPVTGELWASEHGPQGGDEINLVEAGRNYGWPLLTYGRNYGSGTRIGEEGPQPGFEQPLKWWGPTSIAPSGMVFVTSDRYPGWKGSLLVGALRGEMLVRLTLDGRKVVGEERLLSRMSARIRDVRQGPDGLIYLLTDNNDGRVVRLDP